MLAAQLTFFGLTAMFERAPAAAEVGEAAAGEAAAGEAAAGEAAAARAGPLRECPHCLSTFRDPKGSDGPAAALSEGAARALEAEARALDAALESQDGEEGAFEREAPTLVCPRGGVGGGGGASSRGQSLTLLVRASQESFVSFFFGETKDVVDLCVTGERNPDAEDVFMYSNYRSRVDRVRLHSLYAARVFTAREYTAQYRTPALMLAYAAT